MSEDGDVKSEAEDRFRHLRQEAELRIGGAGFKEESEGEGEEDKKQRNGKMMAGKKRMKPEGKKRDEEEEE